MKLLLTDGLTMQSHGDLTLDVFGKFGTVAAYDNIDRETLLREAADADLIICNKTPIDREVISAAKNLQYIGTLSTGYNNVDTVFAREKGIPVCNAAGYSTNAVAQQVFAYILSHCCRIGEYNAFVKEGGWQNAPVFSPLVYSTDEVAGKTLGIIGYGSIGKTVEKIALSFGMKTVVHTRTVIQNGSTEFVELDELLKLSDIVTVHCPLNDTNANMMNAESFAKMKDGAFFINTARGGLVDEQALFDALESGKLSGAAVDVLVKEPMAKDCVLLNAKNITITPHTAWAPLPTRKRLLDIVVSNIEAFLRGKPTNVVNYLM